MRTSGTFSCAILCLLLASTSNVARSQTVAEWEIDLRERLDSVIDANFSEDGPGIAMLVVRNGETVYERYRGMANIEKGLPIRADTGFRLGSLSKTFTALAVIQLYEDERLSLDDSIRTWLPDVPEHWDQVTIRHLLGHRSGIPDFLDVAQVQDPEETFLPDDFDNDFIRAELIHDLELEFEPGEVFEYSNTGYVLLAEIVETASGMGFDDYMQQHIFEPLDMADSFIYDGNIGPRSLDALNFGVTERIYGRNSTHTGTSSQVSSLRDLQTFVAGLLDGRVVSQSTLALMRQRHSKASDNASYGYGFLINDAYRVYGHSGGYDGVRTFLLVDQMSESYLVILQNSGDALDALRLLEPVLPFPSG